MARSLCLLILILLASSGKAEDPKVAFGVALEPIIPSSLFRISTEIKREGDVLFSSTPQPGYAFGAILKFDFTPRLSAETGMNYLVRYYEMAAEEGTERFSMRFKEDSYEIPLTAKYYIRLGQRLYLSNSAGVSMIFIPGSVETKTGRGIPGDTDYLLFSQHSMIRRTMVPAFKGGFGLNYRTESIGEFYFETYYRLFSVFYDTRLLYENAITGVYLNNVNINSIGDFFGFSIRYTFPPSELIRRKKPE